MSGSCWHCGAAHEPRKPHRADFNAEPEFLVACLEWLDYSFPERGRSDRSARIAEWRQIDVAASLERTRLRLRELIELDDWTPGEATEFDELAATWRSSRPTKNRYTETKESRS